jgi:hypothetical protein
MPLHHVRRISARAVDGGRDGRVGFPDDVSACGGAVRCQGFDGEHWRALWEQQKVEKSFPATLQAKDLTPL